MKNRKTDIKNTAKIQKLRGKIFLLKKLTRLL